MKENKKHIHRGEVLQAVVGKGELNITQAVKKAGYSRSSYYNHIEDPDLSFEILEDYGKALKYDFTEDFPDMPKYMSEDQGDYTLLTFEEALQKIAHWREKYYSLVEKYHKLVEEKLALNTGKAE